MISYRRVQKRKRRIIVYGLFGHSLRSAISCRSVWRCGKIWVNSQKVIVGRRKRQASRGILERFEARCSHTWHGYLAKVALHAIFQVNVGLCNRGRRRCPRSFTSRMAAERKMNALVSNRLENYSRRARRIASILVVLQSDRPRKSQSLDTFTVVQERWLFLNFPRHLTTGALRRRRSHFHVMQRRDLTGKFIALLLTLSSDAMSF